MKKANIGLYCLHSFAAQSIAVQSMCISGPADFIVKHVTVTRRKMAATCSDVGYVDSINSGFTGDLLRMDESCS